MADTSTGYPRRPQYFACKFTRRMGKVCLGNDIGPDVCWLLAFIVSTEDAKGYRAPVSFYNEDLATRTGLSLAGMKRARDKAVQAGWLWYEPGAKGRAARYFVTVPAWADGMDDGPGDERPGELSGGIVAQPEPESASHPDGIRTACEPHSSYPLPLPSEAVVPPAPPPIPEPRKQAKPKPAAKVKAPRARTPDSLFDVLKEITGHDSGAFVAKARHDLAGRDAPYTPSEVRDFARRWRELLPWATTDAHPRLTLGIITKHIHTLRTAPAAGVPPGDATRVKRADDNPMTTDAALGQIFHEMELPNGRG